MPIVCQSSANHLYAENRRSPLLSSSHSDTFCQCLCKTVIPCSLPCRGLSCPPVRVNPHALARLIERKKKQVQLVASRCRMSKRFSQEAGSGADPEIPTPRRAKLSPVALSRAAIPSGCSENTMHLEWIRDFSTPHACVPPKTAVFPLPDGVQTGRADYGRSVHDSLHRD